MVSILSHRHVHMSVRTEYKHIQFEICSIFLQFTLTLVTMLEIEYEINLVTCKAALLPLVQMKHGNEMLVEDPAISIFSLRSYRRRAPFCD